MMPFAIGLLPAATGFFLVRALSGGGSSLRCCRHDLFRLVLGTGIGIGLASECFFLGLVTGSSELLLEIVLLLTVGTAAVLNRKKKCRFCETRAGGDTLLNRWLASTFAFLLFLDFAVFVWVSVRTPRGGWDAWAIWNLRAHFLYRNGGVAWRDAFAEVLDWSHPDYPLLLPAFVARGWRLLGRESSAVPIVLAGFFTFGCVGLMTASLTILRGARQGLLAGLALAATPWLYVQGAMQCADIPVAFFGLATFATMAMADRFNSRGLAVLAGVTAALGGWAKNEGLLWFGAFLVARMIAARGSLLPAFMAGAVPVLAPVVFFKTRVATSSDIFGAAGRAGMMTRVLDPARYILIAREAFVHAWNFGPLPISAFALLIVYAAVAGLRLRQNRDRAILRTGVIALAFTTMGYFAIYLLHPNDLAWELVNSADRLLLQMWPGIVFVIFLATRSSGHGSARPLRGSGGEDRCGIC